MRHVAFPRGQGPVFEDLPPTLQPCAIAASAPPIDHVRTAALSAVVYLLLGGAALAFVSFAPPVVLVHIQPTRPERIVEFIGQPTPRLVERPSPPPPGSSGGMTTPGSHAVIVPRPDPEVPAEGLPTGNHPGDLPVAGPAPSGPAAPSIGPAPSTAGSSPTVHDYSATGLAVLRRVEPLYPDFARRARIQGPVVLMMTVDEGGQPIQIQVLEGHPVFHEVAKQAARQWRFEPARMDGRPVTARFRLTLKFALR